MLTLGIVLLVVGVALLVAEAHLPTLGALGAGGAGALVGGGVLTVVATGGGAMFALPVAIGTGAVAAGFLYLIATRGAAVMRGPVRSGAESLVGHTGVLRSRPDPVGQVFVDGALWRARPSLEEDGEQPLREGDPVVVERVQGLTLCVRRAEDWELMP